MTHAPDDPLALGRRAGLPADLLWLLEKHPRGSWDASLGEVGRFWLSRHAMFREAQGLLIAETRAFAESAKEARVFGPRFGRIAGFLLHELEGHHQIEDMHYFPRLARLEPSLQRGFDLLEADHDALHETLESLETASKALLRSLEDPRRDPAFRAADALERLGRLLDRHLADEEDIVAPVLLEHGEAGLS